MHRLESLCHRVSVVPKVFFAGRDGPPTTGCSPLRAVACRRGVPPPPELRRAGPAPRCTGRRRAKAAMATARWKACATGFRLCRRWFSRAETARLQPVVHLCGPLHVGGASRLRRSFGGQAPPPPELRRAGPASRRTDFITEAQRTHREGEGRVCRPRGERGRRTTPSPHCEQSLAMGDDCHAAGRRMADGVGSGTLD